MTDLPYSDGYQIIWLIRRLFRAMGQMAEGYLQELGVTAADRAVMEFIHPDRELTVPEIAGRYNVSRQHVQVTVNRLLDLKLISAKGNPRHKRSPLIVLTRRGRTLFGRIRAHEKELVDGLFSTIGADDRHIALRTLETLYSRLTQENSDV